MSKVGDSNDFEILKTEIRDLMLSSNKEQIE